MVRNLNLKLEATIDRGGDVNFDSIGGGISFYNSNKSIKEKNLTIRIGCFSSGKKEYYSNNELYDPSKPVSTDIINGVKKIMDRFDKEIATFMKSKGFSS